MVFPVTMVITVVGLFLIGAAFFEDDIPKRVNYLMAAVILVMASDFFWRVMRWELVGG